MEHNKTRKERHANDLTQKGLFSYRSIRLSSTRFSELSMLRTSSKLTDKGKIHSILVFIVSIFIEIKLWHAVCIVE